jgi:hypothetical protein
MFSTIQNNEVLHCRDGRVPIHKSLFTEYNSGDKINGRGEEKQARYRIPVWKL